MNEKIIEFEHVVAGYSPSLTILNDLSLDARKAEITLLIGPNGAGTSTVLKTLFGLLVPRSGEIRLECKPIDEPSIGLSPKPVQEVMGLLRQLADDGTTIVMVEQNVRTALKYANRALVLDSGRLALDSPSSELLGDPDMNRLFLGGAGKPAAAAAH